MSEVTSKPPDRAASPPDRVAAGVPPGGFLHAIRTLDAPLLLLAVITFVSSLGIAVMLPLIPLFAISLGAAPAQIGLLISAFSVANALAQAGAGLWLDRVGSRRFIQVGTGTYAAANALIASAGTAASLIAYRALAGLGAGANLVASRVYVTQVAAATRLALANSVLSAATSAGQVAGPVLGGFLAAASLRLPFALVAVTSTLALIGTLRLPPPAARSAATPAAAGDPPSGFNRSVAVLLVSQMLLLAGYGGWITTYAPFATERLGWTTRDVGIIFSFFGLGSITLGPWLAHLADRVGRRRVAPLATVPAALAVVPLVLALPQPAVFAGMFAAGGGLTAYNASWFALLAEAGPAARRGRTFGLVNAASSLGTVAGAMTASLVWERAGLGAALLVASAPAVLAGLSLLALPRSLAGR